MTIPTAYTLATDAQFRELSNFITPPRAGRVTALEGSGQVRVATDDPDGGDVLAWPLNGFAYAVDDVVYITFAVNNPESALVIGSKGATPTLDAYLRRSGEDELTADWDIGEDRAIQAEKLAARDGEGLGLYDDGGNRGLHVADGGDVTVDNDLTVEDRVTANGDGVNAHQFLNNPGVSAAVHEIARFYRFASGAGNAGFSAGYYANGSAAQYTYLYAPGALPLAFATFDGGLSVKVIILPGGDVGIGTLSPQGLLHLVQGSGNMMFEVKSNIVGTKQVIIANGTGDVTQMLTGFFVLSDGTSGVANGFAMIPTDTYAIAVGGSTWTLTVAANGEFSVQRTAGSGSATMTFMITWI